MGNGFGRNGKTKDKAASYEIIEMKWKEVGVSALRSNNCNNNNNNNKKGIKSSVLIQEKLGNMRKSLKDFWFLSSSN